jgi:hypothetical protein
MPSKAVKDAVEARLATWSGIGTVPLADINELGADSPVEQFISVEYPVSHADRVSLGDPGLFREEGVIRFVLYVLDLAGIEEALTWVEELRALFGDEEFAGVETFEASPAEFDSSHRVSGFFPVPFVVPYQYDYQK